MAPLVTIKTRTSQRFATRFAKLAERHDRSVAAEMRTALEAWVAEHSEDNANHSKKVTP